MIFSHVLYQLSYLGSFTQELFYLIFAILSSLNLLFQLILAIRYSDHHPGTLPEHTPWQSISFQHKW